MIKHNLVGFANRMRKAGANVAPAADDVLRKVALAASQTLISATPVDTGRARANWQVSIGDEATGEVGHTSPQVALNENRAKVAAYRGGVALFIQNNVPYIGRLNAGSSAQAPAGFVERALQAAARAVARSKVVTK